MAYDQVVLSPLDAQRQVEQLMLPNAGTDFQWSSGFDPSSLFFAMSSRIPTVEESSLHDVTSPPLPDPTTNATGPVLENVPSDAAKRKASEEKEKTVKIIWWRPHGHTAIAPGASLTSLQNIKVIDGLKFVRRNRSQAYNPQSPCRQIRQRPRSSQHPYLQPG